MSSYEVWEKTAKNDSHACLCLYAAEKNMHEFQQFTNKLPKINFHLKQNE